MNDDTKLQQLKQRFDRGDNLAAVECLVECEERGLRKPEWAHAWEIAGWKAYLKNRDVDLRDAFGLCLGRGRHGDPRQARIDRERYEDAYAAVRAAIHNGAKGWSKFESGARIFRALHPDELLTDDQVKKLYEREQARAPRQEYWLVEPTQNATTCSGTLHVLLHPGPLSFP